jgi:hypothetical protein
VRRSKKETSAIIKRASFLRRLLKENGLILGGFDPGVLAYQKLGKNPFTKQARLASLNFDRTEWAWLEPLLLELRALRRNAAPSEGSKE